MHRVLSPHTCRFFAATTAAILACSHTCFFRPLQRGTEEPPKVEVKAVEVGAWPREEPTVEVMVIGLRREQTPLFINVIKHYSVYSTSE